MEPSIPKRIQISHLNHKNLKYKNKNHSTQRMMNKIEKKNKSVHNLKRKKESQISKQQHNKSTKKIHTKGFRNFGLVWSSVHTGVAKLIAIVDHCSVRRGE